MTRRLKLISDQESSTIVDISALIRADIQARDWSKCHIAGDRAEPLAIEERRKWTWLK